MTPEETGQLISDMLGKGRSLQVIIARSGWSKFEVVQIAESNGYHFDADGAPHKATKTKPGVPTSPHEALQRMYDQDLVDLEQHDQAPTVTIPTTSGPVTIPIKPASAGTEIAHTSTVSRGQRSPVKRIKSLADKCADLLEQLHTLLEEQDAKDRAAAAAAREAAEAKAEVERLEKQLADAKARLRPANKQLAVAGPNRGHVSKEVAAARALSAAIREWGRQAGFTCGDKGRIPQNLMDAYEAAHPEAASA